MSVLAFIGVLVETAESVDLIVTAVGYRSIDQTRRSLAASPNDLRLVAVTSTSGFLRWA